jgi:replicative DNA helicase
VNATAQEIAVPHSIQLEQQVLGAVMSSPQNIERVIAFLKPEHFFDPVHRRIFEYCSLLFDRDRTISPVAVAAYVNENEASDWQPIGGRAYIARLCTEATTTAYVREQAEVLVDYWRRREFADAIDAAYPMVMDMASPFESAADLIEEASTSLRLAGRRKSTVTFIGDAVAGALARAEEAALRGTGLVGISTGLRDLDRKTGGFVAGDMIVLAGRPSMGKTTLAVNIAWAIATDPGDPRGVAYVSPEMTSEELGYRIVADEAERRGERIEYAKLKRGEFGDATRRIIHQCMETINSAPFFIEQAGDITFPAIRAAVKKLAREFERRGTPLGLIVLDHMGLISVPGAKGEFERVSYISNQTKQLAKSFEVPVLALSQLSRQVEARDDKRPQLSDLRQSGNIEQDADIVLFPYRHEYYLERGKPKKFKSNEAEADFEAEIVNWRNLAELDIAKQRNGPIGRVELYADMGASAFRDIDRRHQNTSQEAML